MIKPLIHRAYLTVAQGDDGEFRVLRSTVPGLGSIHHKVANDFQKAVADKIFEDPRYQGIDKIHFVAADVKTALSEPVMERAKPAVN